MDPTDNARPLNMLDMRRPREPSVALVETDRRSQLVPQNGVTGMCVLTGRRRAVGLPRTRKEPLAGGNAPPETRLAALIMADSWLLFGPQTIGDRDFACTRTAMPDAPPENIRRERFRTRLPDLNQLRHQMIDQVIGVNAGCLLPLRILTKCHKPDR